MTEILGDTEIAAPLLKSALSASTALAFPANEPGGPHAALRQSWARTWAGV